MLSCVDFVSGPSRFWGRWFQPLGLMAMVWSLWGAPMGLLAQAGTHAQANGGARPKSAAAAGAASGQAYGVIVVRTEAEAKEVLRRLKAGTDFAVLAEEKSIDGTAKDGGYLGRMADAALPAAYREAAKGLHAGQVSAVVSAQAGYAVLTVLTRVPQLKDLDAKRVESLISQGTVRDTIDISGLGEADAALQVYPKPAGWNTNSEQGCAMRTASYNSAVGRIEQILPRADADPASQAAPAKLMQGHATLAQLYTYTDQMEKAVGEWKKAYAIAETRMPGALPYFEEALGVSYLHMAEEENGVYRKPGDLGFFPAVKPGVRFLKTEKVELARKEFEKYLEKKPDSLEVRWLLNLSYASLGEYPEKVPAAYLMPEKDFAGGMGQGAEKSLGRFVDVAPAAGLDLFTSAGGVVVDDFENNGLLDVATSSMDMCERVRYFHNNGDGTFAERGEQAGLGKVLGGLNLVKGDFNNDGCMDLLVLRGGWETAQRLTLLKNNCNGTFSDVTEANGLGKAITASQTAVFADIDNDGWLDLFVGSENGQTMLFHNKGDGTFEDISHKAGVDKVAFTKGVTAADYDNDGYVDLYVSNVTGANLLYHNNGDGTFREVGRQAGVQAPYYSFATWFFDYDNDGWPDLFVDCYFSSMDEVMRSYLGKPYFTDTLKLFRNMHNGTFEDVSEKVGLDKVRMPMGANFGDIDNDGYLDVYLGMGQPSLASLMPHTMLHNEGGKRFADVTAVTGTGDLHKGHGTVFADFERNGQEDILANMGGAVPPDKHAMRLFRNPGHGNDWINVKLTGVKSNREAVGARIQITVENDGGTQRLISRTVGESSSFGGNPAEEDIGLGHGARIVALDVWWPASGTRQHFTDLPVDAYVGVKELASEFTKLERHAVTFGGAAAH